MKKIKIGFVDFWPGFEPEKSSIVKILRKHFDVEIIDTSMPGIKEQVGYLFYSCAMHHFLDYDCIRIFYTGENLVPDLNLCDYAIGFEKMSVGDRYFRDPLCYDHIRIHSYDLVSDRSASALSEDIGSKRFCAMVVSNGENVDGFREQFFYRLSEYKTIDSGGRYLNNIGMPEGVKDKIAFLKGHKFSLAFENVSHEGYCTEKIIDSFAAGTIPIYWGDPDVAGYFNEKAFINCHSFASLDEVIAKVKEIDADDEKYRAMRMQPVFADAYHMPEQQDRRFEKWLVSIFEREYKIRRNRNGRMKIYGDVCRIRRDLQYRLPHQESSANRRPEQKRKISVIIPCYNAAPYMDRCMASITVQTMGIDDLEIICVDDASTDDTWIHLQKWERLFPDNVTLIHQEVNRRQGAARNIGLQYASADWIAFVDADDWLEPDYLEQLYRPVDQFECDVVACRCRKDASDTLVFSDEEQRWGGGEEGYVLADTEEMTKSLFLSKYLGEAAWGKIIRKDLLLQHAISFPEDLAYEDSYWIPLLYIYAKGVYIIRKRLYHYFINPDSTMLAKNADHHIDMLTVQAIKWEDYTRRGLWQEYREELELDSLCIAACFVRTLIQQYGRPPFSYFQLVRELMKGHVPDHRTNRYVAGLDQTFQLFLEILYSDIDKEGFLQVTKQLKECFA